MDNEVNQKKALEDISFIKEILSQTSTSMEAFNHIFITWGILFLIIGILLIVGMFIPMPGVTTDVIKSNETSLTTITGGHLATIHIILICLSYLVWPVFLIITIKLFKNTVKKHPINGVSKQLMSIWSCILIFLSVCFILSIYASNMDVFGISFNSIEFVLFSLGLFCIYAFTRLAFPLILSIIYSLAALYIMLSSSYNIYLSILVVPFTFLLIGIYFRLRERKVA